MSSKSNTSIGPNTGSEVAKDPIGISARPTLHILAYTPTAGLHRYLEEASYPPHHTSSRKSRDFVVLRSPERAAALGAGTRGNGRDATRAEARSCGEVQTAEEAGEAASQGLTAPIPQPAALVSANLQGGPLLLQAQEAAAAAAQAALLQTYLRKQSSQELMESLVALRLIHSEPFSVGGGSGISVSQFALSGDFEEAETGTAESECYSDASSHRSGCVGSRSGTTHWYTNLLLCGGTANDTADVEGLEDETIGCESTCSNHPCRASKPSAPALRAAIRHSGDTGSSTAGGATGGAEATAAFDISCTATRGAAASAKQAGCELGEGLKAALGRITQRRSGAGEQGTTSGDGAPAAVKRRLRFNGRGEPLGGLLSAVAHLPKRIKAACAKRGTDKQEAAAPAERVKGAAGNEAGLARIAAAKPAGDAASGDVAIELVEGSVASVSSSLGSLFSRTACPPPAAAADGGAPKRPGVVRRCLAALRSGRKA